MNRERLTAFSDGVIAIIITVMVPELRPPCGTNRAALLATLPFFLTYALSLLYVAIDWNNHHHLLHTVRHVSGPIMWANMALLFFLSLTPFATAWLGAHYRAPVRWYPGSRSYCRRSPTPRCSARSSQPKGADPCRRGRWDAM